MTSLLTLLLPTRKFACGRNQFFRRLIRLRQEHFRAAKKQPHRQQAIVNFIYDIITSLSPPGRFKAFNLHGELVDISEVKAREYISEVLADGVTSMVAWQRPIGRDVATFQGTTSATNGKLKRSMSQSKKFGKKKKGKCEHNEYQDEKTVDDDIDESEDAVVVLSSRQQPQQREVEGSIPSSSMLDWSSQRFWPRQLSGPISHADLLTASSMQAAEEGRTLAQLSSILGPPSSASAMHYRNGGLLSQSSALHPLSGNMLYDFPPMHPGASDLSHLSSSRLGHVHASLLLGAPPTLGGLHRPVPSDYVLLPTSALTGREQHLRYGGLSTSSVIRDGSGIIDPRARHMDEYTLRQDHDSLDSRIP